MFFPGREGTAREIEAEEVKWALPRERMEGMSGGAEAVERALRCLGRGFDVTCDFRPKYCKGKERLVLLNEKDTKEIAVPGFGSVHGVSVDIKCDKGERMRYRSDVLEFTQMSELFNRRSSLTGKIPSGFFNAMFQFNGGAWAREAGQTKCLALDGYFISLFNLRIDRPSFALADHVADAVPSSWDPAALARFIENYGTHIIVGLSVGGQDVVLVRQDQSSSLPPSEIKDHIDRLGDQLFTGTCTLPPHHWKGCKEKENRQKVPEAFNVFDPQPVLPDGFTSVSSKSGITVICSKRGGGTSASSHCEWLPTVSTTPDAINFTFMPIISLLKDVPGKGFLSHAINLYLRYKPPISDLEYFLDFQSHKAWAPMLNDHPLGPCSNRSLPNTALQFNLMGPKLYVNTAQVVVGRRPVTGMRLHLEGMKNDRLAVHLQHLSNTPAFFGDLKDTRQIWRGSEEVTEECYYEPVQWKLFSHVCTAAVKYDPRWSASGGPRRSAFIVTGAQLHVKTHESRSVLHLRLLYSEVPGFSVGLSAWERSSSRLSQKLGLFSTISTTISGGMGRDQMKPAVVVDSGVFPTGPPMPVQAPRLLKFVDTGELCRGPQDCPGYWLVTGAKLTLQKGKIGLHVKFSLVHPNC